ncbi:hypothetical protein [Bradyrhizobium sp. B117]|uniref:hypothetical protein n=1 Tax=Bradyrhizobium sp. B117 TaxID=3140246 RepID=UPI003182E14A
MEEAFPFLGIFIARPNAIYGPSLEEEEIGPSGAAAFESDVSDGGSAGSHALD